MNSFHLFAIYFPNLSDYVITSPISIKDIDLWNRLINILRLKEEEHFILFDDAVNIECVLEKESFSKAKTVVFSVRKKSENKQLVPKIHLCAGLTKKEAFEEIAYLASQMGVTTLVPIVSKKVQRTFGGKKELERLKRILVSAAEQSKNFYFPNLLEPVSFENFISTHDKILNLSKNQSSKIICSPSGLNLYECLKDLVDNSFENIVIVVGPEGDFSAQEIEALKNSGFNIVALTPTILRSQEAVAVVVGSIRSVLK